MDMVPRGRRDKERANQHNRNSGETGGRTTMRLSRTVGTRIPAEGFASDQRGVAGRAGRRPLSETIGQRSR